MSMVQNGAIIGTRGNEIEMADGGEMERAITNEGMAIQRVQTMYATAMAVQKPRVLHRVEKSLLDEASLAGESFFYGWGAGKDTIEGPSVDLAMAAFRAWGNCAIEMQPVQETPGAWIFTATFVDLESGVSLPRQFRQSKQWKVYGKLDEERKADVRFQIGQSKAIRNVILNALPKWLISKAMDRAHDGVKAKLQEFIDKHGGGEKGFAEAINLVLRGLEKVGVDEARVLARFGLAKREGIDIDKLIILRGDLTAIVDGRDFANELFPAIGENKGDQSLADKVRGQQPSSQQEQPKQLESNQHPSDEIPDETVGTPEAFATALMDIAASKNVDAEDADKVIGKLRLGTKIGATRTGDAMKARREVLTAARNGKLDWREGKILE